MFINFQSVCMGEQINRESEVVLDNFCSIIEDYAAAHLQEGQVGVPFVLFDALEVVLIMF